MAPQATEIHGGSVSREEWRWVLAWSAVILLLTSLPYVYGALISTPQSQFSGFVIGVADGNSYLAKMRLGATDGWQFHLFYTSESHEGAYVYLFHLLLGKVARLSGLSLILVYHLSRVACGMFLLATVYYFAAFFTAVRSVRRLAFWLVGVGSGLGWLVVASGLTDRLGMPLDFYSPDAFSFHVLLSLPHLALAEALLLWAVLFVLIAWEKQMARYALLAGFALAAMAAIGAFYIVIPCTVFGAGWLLRRWHMRRMPDHPWTEAGLAMLSLAVAAPILVYNAYVFLTNPVFKIWSAQNLILSPAPVHYLLAFGPLALLAAIEGWQTWKSGSARGPMLIGWCILAPVLVYLPFSLQRRLALGAQVPLSILAAAGLWRLLRAEEATRRWRSVSIGVVTLLALSNVALLAGVGWEVSRRSPPIFQSQAEVSAADWLGAHTTSDQVVLAAFETGNYLPTRMSARVFAGHGPETIYADLKTDMLNRFFADGDDTFRTELLRDYGISYVFYGPAERSLGSFSPEDASYLQQVYDNGRVQVYRVVRAGDDRG
jgi:hypothetical protein